MKKTQVFKSIFTPEEIASLKKDFDRKPDLPNPHADYKGFVDRNLDYTMPLSVAHRIIKPKLDRVLGPDHEFSSGAYKYGTGPVTPHIDNLASRQRYRTFSETPKYQCGLLIPMVEGPEYKTVTFDVFSKELFTQDDEIPQQWLTGHNDLDLEDFGHVPEPNRSRLNQLPVDTVYTWRIGDCLSWHSEQLHLSTNYARFGLTKTYVLMFIA